MTDPAETTVGLSRVDRATITGLFHEHVIPPDLFPCIEAIIEAKVRKARASAETDALRDVTAERRKQIAKGYTPEHDDQHSLKALLEYGGLPYSYPNHSPADHEKTRAALVRMSACLLAGIEWLDRRRGSEGEVL